MAPSRSPTTTRISAPSVARHLLNTSKRSWSSLSATLLTQAEMAAIRASVALVLSISFLLPVHVASVIFWSIFCSCWRHFSEPFRRGRPVGRALGQLREGHDAKLL